ncbi:MAG TPA: oxygenase MpaB family protein [Cyclobacteriaceae bacterium]|nr:oxygenase MpaB family protein [Cyclobacteriaceae bacterium]
MSDEKKSTAVNPAYFVNENSIVRQIWGKSDVILLIFAGASAEFALNKAVDWLYFTGRLPADPIARLFSTVAYARAIIFSEKQSALDTIDAMTRIHAGVEAKRAIKIPDEAYRDVLFMLIDYSIRAYEVLERKLNRNEKNEVLGIFRNVGNRMGLKSLPETLEDWELMRQNHLDQNMVYSHYTGDLFIQYRKHLGRMRYSILLEAQSLIVPQKVRELLKLRKASLLFPLIPIFKVISRIKADRVLKEFIFPSKFKKEIHALNFMHAKPESATHAMPA